ncbi:hypothetical protein GCM10020219_102590 [Nonomuraea dietziae]
MAAAALRPAVAGLTSQKDQRITTDQMTAIEAMAMVSPMSHEGLTASESSSPPERRGQRDDERDHHEVEGHERETGALPSCGDVRHPPQNGRADRQTDALACTEVTLFANHPHPSQVSNGFGMIVPS